MNALLKDAVDTLRTTPFLFAVVLLNMVMLLGFGWTLHQISAAVGRRDAIIERCLGGITT